MSHDQLSGNTKLPAPCIVDTGIIVNKQDMQRLLADLSRVRYSYRQDGNLLSEDEGYVLEVFADPQQSTLVANHTLYLNVHSFDYLALSYSPDQQPYFDLRQDNRQLRLIPLSNPLQDQSTRNLNVAALEAVVAEVLSANWDVRIDDEENFPPLDLSTRFSFQCQAYCRHTQARAGVFLTPHGLVETPRFMPVGTLANVKTVTPDQLEATGAQMVLANTYHLHLQPGEEIVAGAGGLHQFMGWSGPILTDSGGFQVFSLSELRSIAEEGVTFRSPRDGQMIHLTPERSIQIQNALGADVIMAFDECPPYPASREAVTEATHRTYRWLERCISAHQRSDQALFAIVQGGTYADLRQQAAQSVAELELPGYAIGGVAVGEPAELIEKIVKVTAPLLPPEKPRYLMGVGTYREMTQAIAAGIDLFDCVIPTRLARHGNALVQGERWNLKNARFQKDFTPLDADCPCYTCQQFTRAYLSHLLRSKELLAYTLLSIHNITELIRFTQRIRAAILGDRFTVEFAQWLSPAPTSF